MKSTMLRLALTGATGAYNYYRNMDNRKQREMYDALLDALREGKLGEVSEELGIDDLEDLYGRARAHAGDLTRDAHDRLDRRRAAFAAAAPDRKARREALKHEAQQLKKSGIAGVTSKKGTKAKKKGRAGKTFGTILGAAAAATAAWAAWEFWLSDKLGATSTSTTRSTAKTETQTDKGGNATLVYSTDSAAGSTIAAHSTDNDLRPQADMRGAAGPLGEDPAERDEELLSSIDSQLSTLDTLDDNQREVTEPRHTTSSNATSGHNSERHHDRIHDGERRSDADSTVGDATESSGRHALREDN